MRENEEAEGEMALRYFDRAVHLWLSGVCGWIFTFNFCTHIQQRSSTRYDVGARYLTSDKSAHERVTKDEREVLS